MFSYYGSKSQIVDYYPRPKHEKIIEPFAGSARYSLKYFERDVLLVDKYEVVVKIWKWLQLCSPNDILGLPKLKPGMDLRKLYLSKEEITFLGMCAGAACISPRNKVSFFASSANGNENRFKRIADQLFKIRHWKIKLGSYEDVVNENATWFIDAPYQFGGNAYKENKIDFNHLSGWSKSRKGQIIVCENTKANWMDFKPVKTIKGASQTFTTEAIWCNEKTIYDYMQSEMFAA